MKEIIHVCLTQICDLKTVREAMSIGICYPVTNLVGKNPHLQKKNIYKKIKNGQIFPDIWHRDKSLVNTKMTTSLETT